mmetsp:Transcript_22330/g.57206  ORF Transcript_22330/g.57206 Transcript_22330/m.57206 type:complete len:214 (+) Transcript_22330:762-1403(+)
MHCGAQADAIAPVTAIKRARLPTFPVHAGSLQLNPVARSGVFAPRSSLQAGGIVWRVDGRARCPAPQKGLHFGPHHSGAELGHQENVALIGGAQLHAALLEHLAHPPARVGVVGRHRHVRFQPLLRDAYHPHVLRQRVGAGRWHAGGGHLVAARHVRVRLPLGHHEVAGPQLLRYAVHAKAHRPRHRHVDCLLIKVRPLIQPRNQRLLKPATR